jgi:DNA-binding response OmpR family regulator
VTGTILLVEDEDNDAFFMQEAMKKAGVPNPIRVASDGRQAIDYFKGAGKFADRKEYPWPCLVVLDLKLPYVMGFEVLKWIRQQPGVPVIVIILSSSKEEEDIATAYRLGANAYLFKPSESSKLQDMAKSIKGFWLTQNKRPPESQEKEVAAALTRSSRVNARTASLEPVKQVAADVSRVGSERPRLSEEI